MKKKKMLDQAQGLVGQRWCQRQRQVAQSSQRRRLWPTKRTVVSTWLICTLLSSQVTALSPASDPPLEVIYRSSEVSPPQGWIPAPKPGSFSYGMTPSMWTQSKHDREEDYQPRIADAMEIQLQKNPVQDSQPEKPKARAARTHEGTILENADVDSKGVSTSLEALFEGAHGQSLGDAQKEFGEFCPTFDSLSVAEPQARPLRHLADPYLPEVTFDLRTYTEGVDVWLENASEYAFDYDQTVTFRYAPSLPDDGGEEYFLIVTDKVSFENGYQAKYKMEFDWSSEKYLASHKMDKQGVDPVVYVIKGDEEGFVFMIRNYEYTTGDPLFPRFDFDLDNKVDWTGNIFVKETADFDFEIQTQALSSDFLTEFAIDSDSMEEEEPTEDATKLYKDTRNLTKGYHYFKATQDEPSSDDIKNVPLVRLFTKATTQVARTELLQATPATSVYTFEVNMYAAPEHCELRSWPEDPIPKEINAGDVVRLELQSQHWDSHAETIIKCGDGCSNDDLYTATFTPLNGSEPTAYTETSTYKASDQDHEIFITPTFAGEYHIKITMQSTRFPDNDKEIKDSPFLLRVLPQNSYPLACELDVTEPMILQNVGEPVVIPVIVRDIYENLTDDFRGRFKVTLVGNMKGTQENFRVEPIHVDLGYFNLVFVVDSADEYTMHVEMREKNQKIFLEIINSPVDLTIMDCLVTQEDLDVLSASNADPITLGAEIDVTTDSFILSDLLTEVSALMELDRPVNSLCGALKMSLTSPHQFLTLDQDSQTVSLEPGSTDLSGVYRDAWVTFSLENYPELSFEIPIEATVKGCEVETLGFEEQFLTVDYEVGTGPVEKIIPSLKQTPNCRLDLTTSLSVVSVNQEELGQAFKLDSEKGTFAVDSSDFTIVGQFLLVSISVGGFDSEKVLKTKDLQIRVNFIVDGGPQFDLASYTVQPLTCSQDDSDWSMTLPPIAKSETQEVSIELLAASVIDLFYLEGNKVRMNLEKRSSLLQGAFCPVQDVTLEFKLVSNVRGTQTETLVVQINKPVDLSAYAVKGSSGQTTAEQKEPEPLLMQNIKISAIGDMTVTFTKNVLWPKLITAETTKSEGNRALANQDGYSINDLLEVKVVDGDDDETLNKKLDVLLTSYDARQLNLKALWQDKTAVTRNLVDPDSILVKILQPGLVLDEVTLKPIEPTSVESTAFIPPQITEEKLQELVVMAETAAKVGGTFSVLEFLGLVSMGKTVTSMWLLINTLQFVVFLGLWQISTSDRLRVTLFETKRISLGEYMDDVDVGGAIGLDFLEKNEHEPTEAVGKERLGDPDPFKSIGSSLIILSGVFVLLAILVGLSVWICMRIRLSDKNRERYTLLNALKLNFIAILAINSNEAKSLANRMMPICLLVILSLLPYIYVCIIQKRKKDLDQPKVSQSIGNLYSGLNLQESGEKEGEKKQKHVWHYIFVFMLRRQLFILLTVLLFDHPNSQMIGHILLTMINSVYLVADSTMFVEASRRRIEVLNDSILLLLSLFVQQFLRQPEPDVKDLLGDITLGVFGLLFVINFVFIFTLIREAIRASKRTKMIRQRREAFEAAQVVKLKAKPVHSSSSQESVESLDGSPVEAPSNSIGQSPGSRVANVIGNPLETIVERPEDVPDYTSSIYSESSPEQSLSSQEAGPVEGSEEMKANSVAPPSAGQLLLRGSDKQIDHMFDEFNSIVLLDKSNISGFEASSTKFVNISEQDVAQFPGHPGVVIPQASMLIEAKTKSVGGPDRIFSSQTDQEGADGDKISMVAQKPSLFAGARQQMMKKRVTENTVVQSKLIRSSETFRQAPNQERTLAVAAQPKQVEEQEEDYDDFWMGGR